MSIYDYHINKGLPKLEKRIKEAEYLESNKNHILDFENTLFAEGLKQIGILRYMTCLNVIAQDTRKDFYEMNERDVKAIVAGIERSSKAAATKSHYKITLKRFFKWLQGDKNAASWISTSMKRCEKKIPENLITEDELKQMIIAADHPRDKAFISVLYDSGCRIGEIGTLKIKNVSFDQYGTILTVHGKTGSRRVRIMFSSSYISAWLDIHPLKDNPESYVFVNMKGDNTRPMLHNAFLKILRKTSVKAGIKKRIYPHLFRHSRATELANHLTEAQMNSHLGWVQGSGMPGVYVHLSGKETDNALLKMQGIEIEETTKSKLRSTICSRCKKDNGPTSSFCSQCGMPLTDDAMLETEKEKELFRVLFEGLLRNYPDHPELLRKLVEKKNDD